MCDELGSAPTLGDGEEVREPELRRGDGGALTMGSSSCLLCKPKLEIAREVKLRLVASTATASCVEPLFATMADASSPPRTPVAGGTVAMTSGALSQVDVDSIGNQALQAKNRRIKVCGRSRNSPRRPTTHL